MSRSVSVEVLLGKIEQLKQEFSLRALSQMPEGPHAAQYHHGVIVGMDSVKNNILMMLSEADAAGDVKDGNRASGSMTGGSRNAYG